MYALLGLIPALPLAGFLVLGIFGRRMQKQWVAILGVGLVGISAFVTLLTAFQFVSSPPQGYAVTQTLWTWFDMAGFKPVIAFRLDALSLVFILVVTFVSFFIHLYSSEFMARDEGYSRFFASMNLFVGSMLVLVLADNLLVLYLGWEGVGLCSYLLIGFWYNDSANGRAARKAFIMTRIGDTALAVGLFLLFSRLGTLNIQDLIRQASSEWQVGSSLAVASAALLLGGAVGKSAQLPLQTWLPDAMAGPTPVSALIHAATMVTAGVYLIARMHVFFDLAPAVRQTAAVIGAVTLLIAGFSALAQTDLKRILAYSTISQIGYMFLALGVGAWPAAVFHFVTHAFFKSLLFLAAGVVILGLNQEHDISKMGGLRKQLPYVFWAFLIGASSLAALPLVTAGFYSKEWILLAARSSPAGGFWLWGAGLLGAFLTALYTFRMVFLTFFGKEKLRIDRKPGFRLKLPLAVLAALSLMAGFLQIPRSLGDLPLFSNFLRTVFPAWDVLQKSPTGESSSEILSGVLVLLGLALAGILFLKKPAGISKLARTPLGRGSAAFFFSGWGFDWIYDRLFVRPLAWLARINKDDVVDLPYLGLAEVSRGFHILLSRTQTGRLRWYAASMVIGAIVILAVAVLL